MDDHSREIEFLLDGGTEFSSMGVLLRIPDDGLSIGKRSEIELTLNHDPENVPGDMTVIRSSGLTTPSETISPRSGEEGRTIYDVPVVPVEEPGESRLRVLVKGGEFRATLGISDQIVKIRPVEISISLPDQPYRWDGSGDLEIGIGVNIPDDERLKGILSVFLTDPYGKRIDTRSRSDKKVKIKGPSVITHSITAPPDLQNDPLDLHIDLSSKLGKVSRTFEGAVLPSVSGSVRAEFPLSISSGEMIMITIGEDLDQDAVSPTLHIEGGGHSIVLEPAGVDKIEGGIEVRYQSPSGIHGSFELRLMIGGSEAASGKISIVEKPPVIIRDIKCVPQHAQRGSEVRFILSFDPGEDLKEDIRAEVVLGGKKGARFTVPLDPDTGTVEHLFTVPRSIPERENPCEVSIFTGEDMILREVRSRVLDVTGVSSLSMDIASPIHLASGSKSPYSHYLMPGEKETGTDRILDLRIVTTSTGRRLLIREDQVVWGEGWSESHTGEVLDRYLLHMFGAMVIEREFATAVERSGDLLAMSASWGASEFSDDVSFDLAGFLKQQERNVPSYKRDDLPPFTRNVIGYISRKPRKGSGKIGTDDLASVLDRLLDGSNLMDENGGPPSSLKKTVEGAVKDMKGGDRKLPGDVGLFVIGSLLKRMFGSLKVLLKTKKRDSLDLEGWRKHIHEIMFDLIALNLVRAEIISTWSDPAIFSWDELRVLRQRSLKREVTSALDLVDLFARIYDSSRERMRALRSNMEIRRTMKALSSLRSSGDTSLQGTPGEIWNGKIRLRIDGSRSDTSVHGSIFLPPGNWQLISPRGSGGDQKEIGEITIPAGGDLPVDIEVKPPRDFSGEARAVLYLYPEKNRLEAEP